MSLDLKKTALGLCLVGLITSVGVSGWAVGRGSTASVPSHLITVVVVANDTPVLYKDCKKASASNGVCYFTTDQDEEIQTTLPCAISKVTK